MKEMRPIRSLARCLGARALSLLPMSLYICEHSCVHRQSARALFLSAAPRFLDRPRPRARASEAVFMPVDLHVKERYLCLLVLDVDRDISFYCY
jgi:hypothetical protein